MPIELPPIYVYPDSYGLVPNGGGGVGPNPGPVIAAAQAQRDTGYVAGNWWSVFNNKLHDLHNNRPKYSFDGMLKGDLVAAHRADYIKATSPGTSDKAAWDAGRLKALQSDLYNTPVLNTETQFSGGIFSPLKAFGHFFMGAGAPASVPLANIGISPTPEKIPELQSAINLAGPGVTNVDLNVAYDTKQDSQIARFYLGNITLHITGQVTRTETGSLTFVGEARAFNDIFDANASTHRNDFDEAATTALRELQNNVHGIPYEISMPGAIPITYKK